MLVVANNFVVRARIEGRERIDAAQYVVEFLSYESCLTTFLEALPPFFEGTFDGLGQGFSRLARHLTGEAFGRLAFYTEWHLN